MFDTAAMWNFASAYVLPLFGGLVIVAGGLWVAGIVLEQLKGLFVKK